MITIYFAFHGAPADRPFGRWWRRDFTSTYWGPSARDQANQFVEAIRPFAEISYERPADFEPMEENT